MQNTHLYRSNHSGSQAVGVGVRNRDVRNRVGGRIQDACRYGAGRLLAGALARPAGRVLQGASVLLGVSIAITVFAGTDVTVARAGSEACTLEMNSDDSYETAYNWSGNSVVPPDYGAFAERYEERDVCGVVLDLTQTSDITGTMDVYVWADNGGQPGPVLAVVSGFDPGDVANFPSYSRHEIDVAANCTNDPVWVGYWGNWPGSTNAWFVGADLDGPGGGAPFTNIAPGIGFPTGWSDVSAVWGPTQALGISVLSVECGTTGACCLPDLSCQILSVADCATASGEFLGPDTSCTPDPCLLVGACCFDVVCAVTDATQCGDAGGVYQGDGSDCSPSPCGPVPNGACCFTTVCVVIDECLCLDSGGVFVGIGATCSPDPCSPTSGTEEESQLPNGWILYPPSPNPAFGPAEIEFSVPTRERVRLDVFDAQGRRMAALVDDVMDAGRHRARWSGVNALGEPAPSGVYFYRVTTTSGTLERKLVRVR